MYAPDENGPPHTDYSCVHATSMDELDEEMRKSLRDGWQPWGSLIVIQGSEGFEFFQPIVELREWPI